MELQRLIARKSGHGKYRRMAKDWISLGEVAARYSRMLTRLSRISLVVIDDWLMAKLTADQRRDLMEVIDDRHQRDLLALGVAAVL